MAARLAKIHRREDILIKEKALGNIAFASS